MRRYFIFIFLLCTTTLLGQTNLRDSVYVKASLFEIMYSEVLQQPIWVKYDVKCFNGDASRSGINFYTCDSIITSDDKDYIHNIYDKGHMAPAADFNCNRDMVYQTFTYLNCALQHQDLNRGVWKTLELYERMLFSVNPSVKVEIKCIYSENSIKLQTGATVPDAFVKTIKYRNKVEVYYFKNEKPISTDIMSYKIN